MHGVSAGGAAHAAAAITPPEPAGPGEALAAASSAGELPAWAGTGALTPRSLGVAGSASSAPPQAAARLRAAFPAAPSDVSTTLASPARSEAIGRMGDIRQRFAKLLDLNWAPADVDKGFDVAMMPALVAAENARHPALKLSFLEDADELQAWLAARPPPNEAQRALFKLPRYTAHSVVAELRLVDGKTSVLLVESLGPRSPHLAKYESLVLPAFEKLLPAGTPLAALALGTQQSDTGCRIFALSFATKLASLGAALEPIHRQNVRGEDLRTPLGSPVRRISGAAGLGLYDGKALAPPSLMKHAQSGKALQAWHALHPDRPADEPVNQKEQTLLGRHDRHRVVRHDGEIEKDYSRSIELKRLTFIDRAIAYLRQAPESECRDLLERLDDWDVTAESSAELELDSRTLGPAPAGRTGWPA